MGLDGYELVNIEGMKKSNKFYGSKLLPWVVVIAVICLFTVISIRCEPSSSFIGGWLASFIISGLFYWFGIKPLIKPQFKEKVIFEIVTKFIGYCGADKDTLNKEMEKDSIEAELLKKLFPETFKFITDYDHTFTNLYVDHKMDSNYAAFATDSELLFYKDATEKDKSEVAEARKKFIEKLNKAFYKDLKD